MGKLVWGSKREPWNFEVFAKAYNKRADEDQAAHYQRDAYTPHLESEYLGPPHWADGVELFATLFCVAAAEKPRFAMDGFKKAYQAETGKAYPTNAFTPFVELVHHNEQIKSTDDLVQFVISRELELAEWKKSAKEPWSMDAFREAFMAEGKAQVGGFYDLPYDPRGAHTQNLPKIYSNPQWWSIRQLAAVMQTDLNAS